MKQSANTNFKLGSTLMCTKSASPAYKEGSTYEVTLFGSTLGLYGEDGLFDPLYNLVSSFKEDKVSS